VDVDELLEWERRGWESLCRGTGAEFYGELMTEDGVRVLAGGTILNRDEVVRSLGNAPPWDTFRIEQPRLVRAGSDSSVLIYRGHAERGGAEPFQAMMSSVYVKSDSGVRLTCYQQTPVGRMEGVP